jgi:hypothetical protein
VLLGLLEGFATIWRVQVRPEWPVDLMADDEPFEVVDSTGLTDTDWAEINKLQRTYREGGKKALNTAMAELAKDPIRFTAVIGAFFPDMIREAMKDAVAEAGMTEEDIREMVRKLESPARDQ